LKIGLFSSPSGAFRLLAIVVLVSFLTPTTVFASNGQSQQPSVSLPLRIHSVNFCPTSSCSTNWGGYAATGSTGSVSDVKASWIVPSVTCPKSGSTYAALWVGIDGYSSSTVEQTGVLVHCLLGKATYSAWYEFYPAASVTISGFSVKPGNTISAEVGYSTATSLFTTTIQNINTGSSFSKSSAVSSAQRSSAEWIIERPETCLLKCKLTTLSNFGTADYGLDYTSVASTNYATISGATGAISNFASAVAITMVSSTGSTLAQSSILSTDGTSFSMKYV